MLKVILEVQVLANQLSFSMFVSSKDLLGALLNVLQGLLPEGQ